MINELTQLQLFSLGVFSSLFVFSSILLSKICDDEKENVNKFILTAKICIIFLTLLMSLFFYELRLVGLFLISYFVIELLISNNYVFKKFKKYYVLRSLSYIIIYSTLLIEPVGLVLLIVYEFFKNTISNFKTRFEVLLFLGYTLTLFFVFLF